MTHQILNGVVERRRKCRRRDDPAPSGITSRCWRQLILVEDNAASAENKLWSAVNLHSFEDVEVGGLKVSLSRD